jgi:hypothetical protein
VIRLTNATLQIVAGFAIEHQSARSQLRGSIEAKMETSRQGDVFRNDDDCRPHGEETGVPTCGILQPQ